MSAPSPRFLIPAATFFAMSLFAANSLLNRMAQIDYAMPALPYAVIRMCSGAIMLWAAMKFCRSQSSAGKKTGGSWPAAFALAAYMLFFALAYIELPAAVGALIIAVIVPTVMVLWGLAHGERLTLRLALGLILALTGLCVLLMPGLSAPPLFSAGLMFLSGGAWGVYCILGKRFPDPAPATAGNFFRGVPIMLAALLLFLLCSGSADENLHRLSLQGVLLAVAAGALASALGYLVWYAVLPRYSYTGAAIVQLSVPLLTALGAIPVLGEPLTLRICLASCAILGGIALAVSRRKTRAEGERH